MQKVQLSKRNLTIILIRVSGDDELNVKSFHYVVVLMS